MRRPLPLLPRCGWSPSLLVRCAALVLLYVLPLLGSLSAVTAWADTTTGPSTTGTASAVSPSTVAVGGTVMYTVSGFPRQAVVEILVDDGGLVASGDSGAEVVTTITIAEDGTFSGSLRLPEYVGEGTHWLRFRACGGPDVVTSEVRTIDYTNRSPYFTVSEVTIIGGTEQATQADTAEPGLQVGDDAQGTTGSGGQAVGQGDDQPPSSSASTGGASDSAADGAVPAGRLTAYVLLALLALLAVVVVTGRRRARLRHPGD